MKAACNVLAKRTKMINHNLITTHSIDEEPVLIYSIFIEKESCPCQSLVQKIGGKSGNPLEYRKAGTRFQNKQCDNLLEK